MSALDELWLAVRRIPKGFVTCYGDLGAALPRPVSGVLVGKWMAQCPPDAPWWRVVGRSGDLLIGRRDPRMAQQQRQVLEAEGVSFVGDQVDPAFFWMP